MFDRRCCLFINDLRVSSPAARWRSCWHRLSRVLRLSFFAFLCTNIKYDLRDWNSHFTEGVLKNVHKTTFPGYVTLWTLPINFLASIFVMQSIVFWKNWLSVILSFLSFPSFIFLFPLSLSPSTNFPLSIFHLAAHWTHHTYPQCLYVCAYVCVYSSNGPDIARSWVPNKTEKRLQQT